jgi:hypothetical protein
MSRKIGEAIVGAGELGGWGAEEKGLVTRGLGVRGLGDGVEDGGLEDWKIGGEASVRRSFVALRTGSRRF